jgi:hypothetical protein
MRTRDHLQLRLGLLGIAATASASPKRRLAVLDFAGPRQLADAARRDVMQVLADQYDVVSTTRWEAAKAADSRQGVFDAQSGLGMCMDGLRFEVDVRNNDRRAATRCSPTSTNR